MRTIEQLILFPVDRLTMLRADADPTPEEQALVINAYAQERYKMQTAFEPGDPLPGAWGWLGWDDGKRWKILHEVAMLWFFNELRKP